jgi:hypothetical protein
MKALEYGDTVLINAPFTREIRDMAFIGNLKQQLTEEGAVWAITDIDVVKQRMIDRNSPRDTWKLEHWDEYIKDVNFDIPASLGDPIIADDLLLFHNSNQAQYE